MVREVLEFLRVKEVRKGVFVDMTVGTGGHTLAILQANPKVEVIGIDKDAESLEVAAERLADYADRVTLIYGDMRDTRRLLQQIGIDRVDGCLIDPGPSLWQMDSKRGFSFLDDTPLDMRMDRSSQITAQTLLQTLSFEELERLVRPSRRTALGCSPYRASNCPRKKPKRWHSHGESISGVSG
jgi:16S rRNA (cytosine1402-N4)-methyltransferase